VSSSSLLAQSKQDGLSVGDIAFDEKTDDPKFQLCNPATVFQSYELRSSSDESRKWISDQLKLKFVFKQNWSDQTGFIVIRFAVNCFGLADRFRISGIDQNFNPLIFPEDLNRHLSQIIKTIKWQPGNYKMQSVDYYQNVTFKIEKGKLKEVLL
jgi:hypothetical protein